MSETAAKKDIQKLQRAIVDGLEDVKGVDIRVFNTEHLSPLFERVIVASGNSNRQTKALATSVRDKVREGGFAKPRVEGEDNGEWIIVDCGQAVAHIMQPAIRQYYNLEEIWGEKPVRLKGPVSKSPSAKRSASKSNEAAAPAQSAPEAPKKVAATKKAGAGAAARPAAKKTALRSAAGKSAGRAPARKSAGAGAPRKRSASSATLQTVAVNKPSTKKAAVARAGAKTAAAKPAARAPAKRSSTPRSSR